MKISFLPLALITVLTSIGSAQSFNVDIGAAYGTPASTYGGAALQPGFWNSMTNNGPMPLQDLSGGFPLGPTLAASNGANYGFGFNNASTAGDDEKLMDDGHDGPLTLDFAGLWNGEYLVFTYAWAPDNPAFASRVNVVNTVQPPQVVGGAWPPNGFAPGVTHSVHRARVSNGTLRIDCTAAASYCTVNGVQIMPVPYFNIDTGIGNPAPSASFSGATTQKGFWNALDGTATSSGVLFNKDSMQTQVMIALNGSHGNFWSNNPGTSGDDELLLDDVQDLQPGPTTWSFSGLPPGSYRVTVYSWTPDVPADVTRIRIITGNQSFQDCGASPGFSGYVLGQTHIQDISTVDPNGLALAISAGVAPGGLYGSINGVQIEPSYAPVVYCTPKINSLGCRPAIAATGISTATNGFGFIVSTTNVINNKPGLYLYGNSGPAATPFQAGFLCMNGPVRRTTPLNSGGNVGPTDCSGVYSIDMNMFAFGSLGGTPQPYLAVPGTVVCMQAWGRDNGFASPNNSTLSNALSFEIGP
jgi:hypothetical protein